MLAATLSAAAPLRVCLVSGANDSAPYATDRTLAGLARYLASDHAMNCTVLTWDPATAGFRDIDRLLEADVAIFFVRRKSPNPHNIAVLRNFFSSGKGFVALRSTSHAWENWPDFDAEVLRRAEISATPKNSSSARTPFGPAASPSRPAAISIAMGPWPRM